MQAKSFCRLSRSIGYVVAVAKLYLNPILFIFPRDIVWANLSCRVQSASAQSSLSFQPDCQELHPGQSELQQMILNSEKALVGLALHQRYNNLVTTFASSSRGVLPSLGGQPLMPQWRGGGHIPEGSTPQPSVATTGGVYKWQGLNRCRLMTCAY